MNEYPMALAPAEAARCLSVSQKTVYRLIERGELHAKKIGRVWRVPTDALREYLADSGRPKEGATK